MHNPNTMTPTVFKQQLSPNHSKEYRPAFTNQHNKLMFLSKGKPFTSRFAAQVRANMIWERWRKAFQDSMNVMLAQIEKEAAEKEQASEKNHITIEPASLVIEAK